MEKDKFGLQFVLLNQLGFFLIFLEKVPFASELLLSSIHNKYTQEQLENKERKRKPKELRRPCS